MKKFRDRYMAGEAEFEEIFDLTDTWNLSGDPCTLREYLGLTSDEEDVWISESDESLKALLDKKKKTKIFFTDLDGTLLNDKKEIGPETQRAIDDLFEQGHILALTTGRALESARKIASRLGVYRSGCYLICYNGAQIYDIGSKKSIFFRSLPVDFMRLCFDNASGFGINIQAYSDTEVLTEHDNDDLHKYSEIQHLPTKVVPDITRALPGGTPKMLVLNIGYPDRVAQFRGILAPAVKGRADLFLSQPDYLEIVPVNINKGAGVSFLCDYIGIPLTNSVAAGDAENDLSMICAAHVGACMCNGDPNVQNKADYITRNDNNHDGAAEIIHKFIL